MASGSVFSRTLETVTSTKLEELSKQQTAFSEQYDALLSAVRTEKDPLERLQKLAEGTKSCLGVKTSAAKTYGHSVNIRSGTTYDPKVECDLENLERFMEQARFDPSVSSEFLQDWEDKILQHLSTQATKFQYADLYGKLVAEWLSSEKDGQSDDSDVKMDDDFEEVPGRDKLEAQSEWENLVFEPADIDTLGLKAYLDELFDMDDDDVSSAMENLREEVQDFESRMASPSQFNTKTLRWSIEGLMKSDLLSNEKREVIGDFLSNQVILSEIADVLNMRLEALDGWTWGDYVRVEQRRKLNGRFSIHMHEDLLTAIFLYYIGTKWSVFFKAAFKAILKNEDVWKSSRAEIAEIDYMRRSYYLGNEHTTYDGSLQRKRIRNHKNQYFSYQLLNNVQQHVEVADGEDEAELGKNVQHGHSSLKRKRAPVVARRQVSAKACRKVPVKPDEEEDEDEDGENDAELPKNPMDAKQTLLHQLSIEMIINTRLHGELTCFRTVFDSWNSVLPHETALTVLEFFGVSSRWRKFFQTFLRAPLKFEDDARSEPRSRLRGTPESHVLSDVLGEVVLFCLDFSVNQSTDGQFVHRMSDDVWFWHKDYDMCVSAWDSIIDFADAMGVRIDTRKTGSIRAGQDEELEMDDRLPEGDIQWGFLHLDPSSGQFKINQTMVESHARELRQQLEGKSKSIIDWIQAWNSYAGTFFSTNFGKAANCFGRDHVDNMLSTHRRIQEIVFDGGNVLQHLKRMIEDRFAVSNIPDGFLLFPVELGGLAVSSPFVDLLQIRKSVVKSPRHEVDKFVEQEEKDYLEAQRIFYQQDSKVRYNEQYPDFMPEDPDSFFPLEEYTRYREVLVNPSKADLGGVYDKLLCRPTPQPIERNEELILALSQLKGQHLRGIIREWNSMTAHWQYIVSTYGSRTMKKFGGLNIVEPGWLPIGMISQLRQRRTRWKD